MDHWDCTRDQASLIVSLRHFLKQDVSNATPTPPSFIVRPHGALRCTFIDNNNNINSFWFLFYFIGNYGDDV
jgi:hypothetical protein